MRGIDTNILLRMLTRDDASQAQSAEKLISESVGGPGLYIDILVLVETIWVLSSKYDVPRHAILETVAELLASEEFEFESRPTVQLALDYAEQQGAGFVDALIATRNLAAGCETTLTFDHNAAKRIPGMDLLA